MNPTLKTMDYSIERPTLEYIQKLTEFFAEQVSKTTEQWYTAEDIEWNIVEHHTQEHFSRYLKDPKIYLWIMKFDSEIVGYTEARESTKNNKNIHVWWILVESRFQKRGIAKALYERLETYGICNWYSTITASTKKQNYASIKFHENIGFVLTWESDEDFDFIKQIL